MSPVPPTKEQIAAGAKIVIEHLGKVLDVSAVPEAFRPLAAQMAEKVIGDLIAQSGINVQEVIGQVQLALELRAKLQSFLG